eukprot:g30071.t1
MLRTARRFLTSGRSTQAAQAVPSAHERFLFDLHGFLHVPKVLSAEEVSALNSALDHSQEQLVERAEPELRNTQRGSAMDAPRNRKDLGKILLGQHGHLFRALLVHPRLVPYLTAFCGEGFRLDHQPMVISQEQNSEGFQLHGGPMMARPSDPEDVVGVLNPELQYRYVNGEFWNSLVAMSVQLCDTFPGDGGLCLLRGSHKLNMRVPDAMRHGLPGSGFQEHIYQPSSRAGDVLFFSEATVHGALPWKAPRTRRLALFRFAPANMAYGRGYTDGWGGLAASHGADMSGPGKATEAQQAVLEPPYSPRLNRPLVRTNPQQGTNVETNPRSARKVQHDEAIFGTRYF